MFSICSSDDHAFYHLFFVFSDSQLGHFLFRIIKISNYVPSVCHLLIILATQICPLCRESC